MREIIVLALLIIGVLFSLLGGLGMLRLPDLYMRLSAGSKAATLGAGSLLLAVAVYFGDAMIIGLALATGVFVAMTTPVAAHMIARAAYRSEVPLWPETQEDEETRQELRRTSREA